MPWAPDSARLAFRAGGRDPPGKGFGVHKGFTLLELVVAAALAFLVLGLATAYFIPAMRISARVGTRVEMQQMAAAALAHLERDLRTTSTGGVSLKSVAPAAVAANPLERVAPDGTLVWSATYLVTFFDQGRLRRREWPPEPPVRNSRYLVPSRAKRLEPAVLQSLTQPPFGGAVTTLASGVTAFRILQAGTDQALVQPLRFELELEREVASDRRERLRYSRTVFLSEQRT